ncbi:MAG TPA: hypothetical protein VLH08_04915, partial [Acidobacteriota bacterium]|nr:hypothetical protein [Acidobacteriota bacterium]
MIEAHVTNSTMLKSIRETPLFHYADIFHGCISASFIFIAGFAFTLTLEKKWDDFLHFRKPLWLQIQRLIFIFVLGYWLHANLWSFSGMMSLTGSDLIRFLRADVLMCIALSLMISLLCALIIRHKTIVVYFIGALALAVVFATPFLYEIDATKFLPMWAAQYVNNKNRSLFPLFSWSAYSFLGTLLSYWYLKAAAAGKDAKYFTILAVSGVLMTASAFALFYVPWSYHTYTDVARASPRSFMMRLGIVFFALSMTWLYERKRKPEKSVLAIQGQESLFVYAFHLMIVYGSQFTSHSLSKDIGPNLMVLPSLALTVTLILFCGVIAMIWHHWKKTRPKSA